MFILQICFMTNTNSIMMISSSITQKKINTITFAWLSLSCLHPTLTLSLQMKLQDLIMGTIMVRWHCANNATFYIHFDISMCMFHSLWFIIKLHGLETTNNVCCFSCATNGSNLCNEWRQNYNPNDSVQFVRSECTVDENGTSANK